MPENVAYSYRHARRASLVGAACMYVMACLLAVITLGTCHALVWTPVPQGPHIVEVLLRDLPAVVATVLLAEFLRRFAQEGSPLGRAQSIRLTFAAALLLVYLIVDSLLESAAYAVELVGGPVAVGAVSQNGFDPVKLSLVVFLACLAVVIRYGNALKEDSDSIV